MDYTILLGSHQEHKTVRQHLLYNKNYVPARENAFVLILPDGIQVDLLPFERIQSQGSLKIDGTWYDDELAPEHLTTISVVCICDKYHKLRDN